MGKGEGEGRVWFEVSWLLLEDCGPGSMREVTFSHVCCFELSARFLKGGLLSSAWEGEGRCKERERVRGVYSVR